MILSCTSSPAGFEISMDCVWGGSIALVLLKKSLTCSNGNMTGEVMWGNESEVGEKR